MDGIGRGRAKRVLGVVLTTRTARFTASAVGIVLTGLMVTTLTAPGANGSEGSGGLHAKPFKKLTNDESIVVYGRGLNPGDEVVLMQCLRTATDVSGCDPSTTTSLVTVSATGKLPATSFTVMTGTIGTGTCGTSAADALDCEIAAQDLTAGSTFVAYANIRFKDPPTTTTSTTTSTFPSATSPSASVPSAATRSLP